MTPYLRRPAQSHNQEDSMSIQQISLTHTNVGIQIQCAIYPEISSRGAVRRPPRGHRPVFRELVREKESTIIGGYVMSDHVHMLISIPMKLSVSFVVGF